MMKIGLFPFELVEKSSRIIIYGYGALGHQYLLQIGKSKYCEILYFVDQNYLDYRNDPRCRVVSLETLYREPQENYDRVLIAIDDPEISGKVKETLHMGGIPQERIIVTKETRIYDWDWPVKISEKQLYEEEAALEEYVVNRYDSLAKAKMHTAREYLPDLSALIDVTPDKEELLALLKERLSRMLDGPEKIILLQLMYQKEVFDAECFRMFVAAVDALDEYPAMQYSMCMDCELMWFQYPAILYDEYFLARRELMRKIAGRLQSTWKVNKRPHGDCFRVAIIPYQYCYETSGRGNPTVLTRMNALALQKVGAEVMVFSGSPLQMDDAKDVILRKLWAARSIDIRVDAESQEAGVDIWYCIDQKMELELWKRSGVSDRI